MIFWKGFYGFSHSLIWDYIKHTVQKVSLSNLSVLVHYKIRKKAFRHYEQKSMQSPENYVMRQVVSQRVEWVSFHCEDWQRERFLDLLTGINGLFSFVSDDATPSYCFRRIRELVRDELYEMRRPENSILSYTYKIMQLVLLVVAIMEGNVYRTSNIVQYFTRYFKR